MLPAIKTFIFFGASAMVLLQFIAILFILFMAIELFLIYFVLGPILGISRFSSAVLALSLFEGAYASEIFRAGIVSISKGQWEAAYSLGMNVPHAYRYIILPQAIPRILPTVAPVPAPTLPSSPWSPAARQAL